MVVVEVNGYKIEPGADLYKADLYKANLQWANLEGANLSGATADETTVWPEGFDPVAAEVIFD